MTFRIAAALLLLTFAASVIPVAAHHSVSATFDTTREITIRGVITKIEWSNPHTRFWVDANNANGTISNWELELAPPNALKRSLGIDFINPQDPVVVVLWQANDGSKVANALTISKSDGRVFNFSRDVGLNWEVTSNSNVTR